MSDARAAILSRLRGALQERAPFPAPPTVERRLPVTEVAGDRYAWLERFGQEIVRLGGSWEYAENIATARLRLLNRLQAERVQRALAWEPELLPLPGLQPALADIGIELIVPDFRHGDRVSILRQASEVDLGITGVVAALASTGTLVVRSGRGLAGLASLITPRHLALVPMSCLYPSLEAWLAEMRASEGGRALLAEASNLTFISGPSRTSDIEMTLTLGVHGPRQVEVFFFEEW